MWFSFSPLNSKAAFRVFIMDLRVYGSVAGVMAFVILCVS